MSEKLGDFLREVSNWEWDEFVRAESNMTYTSNEAIIFSLIRSCAMQKLDAIKMSLNRLDGKLKTPVIIETPKVFYVYPNATVSGKGFAKITDNPETTNEAVVSELLAPKVVPVIEPVDLPSLSLRETLAEMAKFPRELPVGIIMLADETQLWVQKQGPMPAEIPKVKSVVAAHLLTMAQNRNLSALSEVFDQLDGKLAETIKVIGEDIYITSYASTAPDDAILNQDGVFQAEATQVQNLWALKLGGQIG